MVLAQNKNEQMWSSRPISKMLMKLSFISTHENVNHQLDFFCGHFFHFFKKYPKLGENNEIEYLIEKIMVFRIDGTHFTMRAYGVNQIFRVVKGICLHRKSRQI